MIARKFYVDKIRTHGGVGMKAKSWLVGAWLLMVAGVTVIPLSPWVVLKCCQNHGTIEHGIDDVLPRAPWDVSFWHVIPGMVLGVLMVFLGVYLRDRYQREHRWPQFHKH